MSKLRLWGGQVCDCKVVKKFLFMRLVQIQTGHYSFGEYMYTTNDLTWRPVWRIYDV